MDAALFHTRPSRLTRRSSLVVGAASAGALALGCGWPAAGPAGPRTTAGAGNGILVQPVIPGTDTAVGKNRFAVGILRVGQDGALPKPITDAELTLRFFHPIEPQAILKSQATPQYRYVGDKNKGMYIAEVHFDQPGAWGIEVAGTTGGEPLATARVQFQVKPRSETPAIGGPAPRSRNLTRYDVDDIKKIDSGATPNDMHELSIAAALDQKKPLVVVFASPGFCVTQTCAPQVGEVQRLKAKHGDKVNFVHVEVFKDPATRTPYEAVIEWKLTSEPWTFFVDRDGLVAAKFEGPAPFEELDSALQPLH